MLSPTAAFHCSELSFGSKLHIASIALRDRVLRMPLGLAYTPQELQAEAGEWHLAVHDGSALFAVLLLRKTIPDHCEVLKMRQVAVDTPLQGKGIGARLVRFAEDVAREQGCRRIELHAREQAVPFYRKLGYSTEGEWFEEVGLPHLAMYRNL